MSAITSPDFTSTCWPVSGVVPSRMVPFSFSVFLTAPTESKPSFSAAEPGGVWPGLLRNELALRVAALFIILPERIVAVVTVVLFLTIPSIVIARIAARATVGLKVKMVEIVIDSLIRAYGCVRKILHKRCNTPGADIIWIHWDLMPIHIRLARRISSTKL